MFPVTEVHADRNYLLSNDVLFEVAIVRRLKRIVSHIINPKLNKHWYTVRNAQLHCEYTFKTFSPDYIIWDLEHGLRRL